ncbi:hypothetical protein [Longimicrobium sp.]|uniref:hypothetical protein n=1 Tax=Longimicrobium sp. TaxID=2029185 RepID=UPI003B3B5CC7
MRIPSWSDRTPGTGRLILVVCVFGSLFVYLVWAAFIGGDRGGVPHPVAAEFRLVLVDGKPPGSIACNSRRPGGRIVLGTDGRWWMRVVSCRLRYGMATGYGVYRWSGDTLILARHHPHRGEIVQHVLVRRGDTLDITGRYRGKKSVSRYVRVPPARP